MIATETTEHTEGKYSVLSVSSVAKIYFTYNEIYLYMIRMEARGGEERGYTEQATEDLLFNLCPGNHKT